MSTTTTDIYAEKALFAQIAAGDAAAFEKIFQKYRGELLPFIIKLTGSNETAKEVIQDIFLEIWQNRSRLINIESPRAWIIRLASNISINYLRRQAAEGRLFERLRSMPPGTPETEQVIAAKETERLITEAVSLLSPAERTVYQLSRDNHLTIPQIAERQQVSPNTVKNQLVAALKRIRRHLEQALLIVAGSTLFYLFVRLLNKF